jgi:hypothetical protein
MLEWVKQIVRGLGYGVCRIPHVEIAKQPNVFIQNHDDLQETLTGLIDEYKNDEWHTIFEHGILNKKGYPKTAKYSHVVGKDTNRYQMPIPRPVEPGSNKTAFDNSHKSKIWLWAYALCDVMFNSEEPAPKKSWFSGLFSWKKSANSTRQEVRYKPVGLALLKTIIRGREQFRHHDMEAHCHNDEYGSDFAIVIPIKVRGSLCGWDYSHHVVHATECAKDLSLQKYRILSAVREFLKKNPNFKIEVDECGKKVIFFDIDEMCVFTGNFVHAGAENETFEDVYRFHIYIVRENADVITMRTFPPSDVVWDLTRKGAASEDIFDPTVGDDSDAEEELVDAQPPQPKQKGRPAKKGRGRPRKDSSSGGKRQARAAPSERRVRKKPEKYE